ncbi:4-alpha-glucanotransferase [Catenovulum maritimum]|uniref:4-alpha-glucanotransferase n=1 Tax=Catenovulum maritimum TaxID=1513271 RepID=A0A0J8GWW1_9ALTE|nr:4-alpha-glucanotransferase [Catenovulum maritimum]KMT65178.1 4-alpha-glucanotransferase [Catenovulum maritimum]
MNSELIDQVAKAKGIETRYVNAWGKDAVVDPESKAKLLKAMGYEIDNEDKFKQQIEKEASDYWLSNINPVKIIRQTDILDFEFRVAINEANDPFDCKITLESGQVIEFSFIPVEGALIDVADIDELEHQEYLISTEIELPCGYHQLSITDNVGQNVDDQSLIVAPKKCYKPEPIAEGKKVWGTSVQLYCVRSERNWGMGDFTDLNLLISEISARGGDFIGLNPIHALSPSNPEHCSPYSPSSRRWLNVFYIDPEVVDGFSRSTKIQSLIDSPLHKQLKVSAKETDYVDYDAIAKLKMPVFKLLFEWFIQNELNQNTDKAKAFKQFITAGGESLKQQAIFDAVQEDLHKQGIQAWGWPSWPEKLNQYDAPAVQEFAEQNQQQVQFYMYLQWLAAEQIKACQNLAEEKGMTIGIYRDLAVGVSSGSAEVWANQDLYCADISVGAPPDPLGPLGQSWGLPPMEPNKLYQQKYQPIIDLYRANMQSCGALRIDHVMALLRLWWVPGGEHATKGAFVYYPIDDLLALLCLESQRNQCMIIGEDLGTVPEGIREILHENAVLSYRVFFFETAPDGGFYSPVHYPEQAMATLTTHDMPTLRGYWHCEDLKLGQELGIYPEQAELDGLFHARHHSKQRILDSLHGHAAIHSDISHNPDQVEMDNRLNYAMQVHMAKAASCLLSLQLEDWLEMDLPVNVPGTCDEYPNWRRKLSQNLETLFALPQVNELTKQLCTARKEES